MVLTGGVHGPTLSPIESLAINTLLIGAAFFLLLKPNLESRRSVLMLSSITLAAAASRVALEPFPNVQPLTVMCLVVGGTLGARRGMAFAVIATLLSNLVLSNGWWTLFQASGWALIALAGSKLAVVSENKIQMKRLVLVSAISSLLFGWWVSLSIWTPGMGGFEFAIYLLNGLPFDAMHVLASIVSAIWIAPWLCDLIHEEVVLFDTPSPVGEVDVSNR
ncbi:MAG: Uncharacterised protein [Methanobacteriota archaeon]|nr:MAG: Uncharacterised protein [Euryarchaeota archaeon]|tara:strand:- start:341 stop:1000 length:660 start_codon:yes stop_codon:yes gene_type:complete